MSACVGFLRFQEDTRWPSACLGLMYASNRAILPARAHVEQPNLWARAATRRIGRGWRAPVTGVGPECLSRLRSPPLAHRDDFS